MKTIAFVSFFVFLPMFLWADTVIFKDGRKIEGKIVGQTGDLVTVEVGEGEDSSLISNYHMSDIASINKSDKAGRPEPGSASLITVGDEAFDHSSTTDDDEAYRALRAGMTKKQVLSIVGAPDTIRKSDTGKVLHEKWYFSSRKKSFQVLFEDGIVVTINE